MTYEQMLLDRQKTSTRASILEPIFPEPAIRGFARTKDLSDIPVDTLLLIRVRMYALGALVWDYTDSVLLTASNMRIEDTIRLSRAVRELRTDYDTTRKERSDRNYLEREMNWALDFEELLQDRLDRFVTDIGNELEEAFGRISPEYRVFLIGVQQAAMMLEALMTFVEGCDKAISDFGVELMGRSIMPRQFRKLAILIPEFAGDMWLAKSPSRNRTAKEVAMELTRIVTGK
ncbi:MAG: hypothetical protein NC311_14925 [Muribaculaceae bacterium]|nr:hypothetical protein [Muribaculaceae bacterium]